jgi:hypothetical protein
MSPRPSVRSPLSAQCSRKTFAAASASGGQKLIYTRTQICYADRASRNTLFDNLIVHAAKSQAARYRIALALLPRAQKYAKSSSD